MSVNDEDAARQAEAKRIADRLSDVGLPDSRFDRDFGQFIPDFVGSRLAGERIAGLPAFLQSQVIFCTLETGLWEARQVCLRAGKSVVMPTFGLRRGLYLLSPGAISQDQYALATCLDGLEVFGKPVGPDQIFDIPGKLFLCGSSAVCRNGTRFGMGAGYIDCEWWIARALGLVTDDTQTVAIVHDCQITDTAFSSGPNALGIDLIVTPGGLHDTGTHHRPTRWPALDFDLALARQDVVRRAQLMII